MKAKLLLIAVLVLTGLSRDATPIAAADQPDESQKVQPANAPARGTGPVKLRGFIRVIDGDTLETYIDDKRVGIGLIGLDAPMGNTKCGRQATARLRTLVKNGLDLEEDPSFTFDSRFRRMYYARTRDDRPVAEELIKSGVARADSRGAARPELTQAEAQARAASKGCVWGGPAAEDDEESSEPTGFAGRLLTGPEPPAPAEVGVAPLATTLPNGFVEDVLAYSLNEATAFTFLPDGRILIAEKAGIVKVVKNGQVLSTPFIDIRSRVNDYWDHGLLGIAADPNFASNGYVYLYYIYEDDPAQYNSTKTGRLVRVTASGDTASPSSEVVLLGKNVGSTCKNFPAGADCIPADGPSHTGGNIKFAPDGTLFLTTGDATHWNIISDDALRSQDIDSLGGKLLHVTTSGAGVPSNPFWNGSSSANRSKVYAYGLRNPFRFNLRPGSGVPYIGDVGSSTWEEIDVGVPGSNFGWPCYEGNGHNAGYDPKPTCQALYGRGTSAVRMPLYTYGHTANAGAAAIGGAFYTGSAYPSQYQGAFFYADFSQGYIRTLQVDSSDRLVGGPNAFATDAYTPDIEIGLDGNLYYLGYYSRQLLRVRYNAAPPTGGGCPVGQWQAEYYANRTLSGSPASQQCEASLNHNWGSGGPSGVGSDSFSARWTGQHDFAAGTYTFTAWADDGIRVWLDGTLIIDGWKDQPPTQYQATQAVSGGRHQLKVEYYEAAGGALAQLAWSTGGTGTPPTVTISSPSPSVLFKVGDVINLSGSAVDAGGAAIPASSLAWDVKLQHCPGFGSQCHTHPFVQLTGATGTFQIPDHGDGTYFDITLTATDSTGQSGSSTVTIRPQTVQVTLDTSPSGLQVVYVDQTGTAPFTHTTIVGSSLTILAPSPQGSNVFQSWSDGGAQQHTITVGSTDATYVARFGSGTGGGCPVGQWQAEYYANRTLSGSPASQQCEASLNHNWGSGGPSGVGSDSFSARWTGQHDFAAGTYTFTAWADDGIRVWLDGTLIIDGWKDQPPTQYQATQAVSGGRHQLKVEYYEAAGGAVAQLAWQAAATSSCPVGQYLAEYYGNRTLSGSPVKQQCESSIDYDWRDLGPSGLGTGNFSIRWTGQHTFAAGTYTFTAAADDGIRVWLDGNLIIDGWKNQPVTQYQATQTVSAGQHQVKVEYYEATGYASVNVSWR